MSTAAGAWCNAGEAASMNPQDSGVMRALVVDHSAPSHLSLRKVPRPSAAPGQILLRVHALSLNRGETRRLEITPEGTITGWDTAGVVEATFIGGPAVGSRVVAFGWGNGWAQYRVADPNDVAALPPSVSYEQASTLPIAGVTALRCLRLAGARPGARLLVTGATGGVGRFAVQLAKGLGSEVTALVRRDEQRDAVSALGATKTATTWEEAGSGFTGILESVGGPSLDRAVLAAAPTGVIVSFGNSSGAAAQSRSFGQHADGRVRRYAFNSGDPIRPDLEWLLGEVSRGELDVGISRTLSWERAPDAVQLLLDRKLEGKVVLTVT
jgi:NADPH2:quinone reductase